MDNNNNRSQFASRIGFLLATAGSAVGLGNLWKFPYMTGNNGGFLFILVSCLTVAFIGAPVMMGEMAIGRRTQKNPVGAYRALDKRYTFAGVLGVGIAFVILSYYSVIGGWVLKYIVTYLTGGLKGADTATFFVDFISNPYEPILWHMIFMAVTVGVCYFGVTKGIEKASKVMMPALFIILVIVAIRAVTLPNSIEGLKFLFTPNFEKIASPDLYIGALSQTFYSLSLGMGIIITYGSYTDKNENIVKSAGIVSAMDLSMAVLSSIAIMPIVFSFGLEPTAGPSLIFVSLPLVFEAMPFGIVFAILFFVLVLFAAATSSISLLETSASYTIDELKWSRKKSVLILGTLLFLLGIPSSLSNGIMADFHIMGMNFFDFLCFFGDNIVLPISALSMCIFIGTSWKVENACAELSNGGKLKLGYLKLWSILIKYVAPIAIAIVFVYGLIPYITPLFA